MDIVQLNTMVSHSTRAHLHQSKNAPSKSMVQNWRDQHRMLLRHRRCTAINRRWSSPSRFPLAYHCTFWYMAAKSHHSLSHNATALSLAHSLTELVRTQPPAPMGHVPRTRQKTLSPRNFAPLNLTSSFPAVPVPPSPSPSASICLDGGQEQ